MIHTSFDYHGWRVELIPETNGYSFRCWRAGTAEGITDGRIYATRERTLAVARQRADLESACLALLRFLNDLGGRSYYLTGDDRAALTDSLLEFARAGSLS
ncbi:hypothetical protein [Pannus brasiliensis]